jgi:FOG: WD40 repeat
MIINILLQALGTILSSYGTLNIKDLKAFLKGHSSEVNSLVITLDDKYIISGSWDNTIRIWDLLTKKLENVFKGHDSWVNCVGVTRDMKHILSGGRDNYLRI